MDVYFSFLVIFSYSWFTLLTFIGNLIRSCIPIVKLFKLKYTIIIIK